MTAALFLGFVAIIVLAVIAFTGRYLGRRAAIGVVVGLALWFLYIGVLVHFGIPQNTTLRPPGAMFILLPVVIFFVVFIVRTAGTPTALAFPLSLLLGAQTFRIVVELFLHQLYIEGVIPKMLTYQGANLDIYIGVSAPLIAVWAMRGRLKLARIWNVLGISALTNVVVRAVLSAPGPWNLIHTQVPNLMMGRFPFLLIPGFLMPLAIVLHVLAIQSIRRQMKQGASSQSLSAPQTARG